MTQSTVLIISDDPDFSRAVVNRWQIERTVPAFTVMGSHLAGGASTAAYDVAIVSGIDGVKLRQTLASLSVSSRPVIFLAADSASAKTVHEEHPRVMVLRSHEGWVDDIVVLASESLRRVDASNRAERAEKRAAEHERDATLGRYMLELRHNLNNALTSVLGNAELLLMEPGALSPQIREQIGTIHTMALRINEIVQRFSSLETEMNFTESESHLETKSKSQAFVSGS